MTDRFLSPAMVCELLPGMTEDALAARRKRRQDPPFYKPTGQHGGFVFYIESEILDWVRASRVDTRPLTSDVGGTGYRSPNGPPVLERYPAALTSTAS